MYLLSAYPRFMPRAVRRLTELSALGPGGRALWDDIVKENPGLQSQQKAQLLEACRMKDRLDKLDEIIRGDARVWTELVDDHGDVAVTFEVDRALTLANATADKMKQLLAAARLLDTAGKPPLARRAPAGVYQKGNVSSIERARERAGG